METPSGLAAPRGSVLIMALWVLTMLSLIGCYYAVDVKIQRNLGQQLWDDMSTRAAARSLLLLLSRRVATPDIKPEDAYDQGLFVPDGREYHVSIGGRDIIFDLEDERGKLDLNHAGEEQIRKLVRGILSDRDIENADTIVDSILDWRDQDKLVRLNGAEDEIYAEKKPPYHPANGPFHLLEELLLINGVDIKTYYGPLDWKSADSDTGNSTWEGGLQDLFTVYNTARGPIKDLAPLPVREILGDDLSGSVGAKPVFRLKMAMGSRKFQMFWMPGTGDETFQLIHWGEMLSSGETWD